MMTLNQCKFELISLELIFNESVGYPGMTSSVNQSIEWQENISIFGEIHCRKLKRLEILGNENIFPIRSFLRKESSVKHGIATIDLKKEFRGCFTYLFYD